MDKLLTAEEVADALGVPLGTIYAWRYKGTAPRAVRVGKHLRFRQADVDVWLEAEQRDQDRRRAEARRAG